MQTQELIMQMNKVKLMQEGNKKGVLIGSTIGVNGNFYTTQQRELLTAIKLRQFDCFFSKFFGHTLVLDQHKAKSHVEVKFSENAISL